MILGAHFLTDVSVGAFVSVVAFLLLMMAPMAASSLPRKTPKSR